MTIPSSLLAQTILKACKAYGIKDVVISPGSRNAPLTLGFTNDPYFNTISIIDERCAAFFGLGMAQQTKKPVALVCTSGSALLNYYPAIAEAFYSRIPLLVLSADRPTHLVGNGDGQTIHQSNIFHSHVCAENDLVLTDKIDDNLVNIKITNEVLTRCIAQRQPVHLNVPFDEPLYDTVKQYQMEFTIPTSEAPVKAFKVSEDIMRKWQTASKKLVLIGCLPPNSISDEIVELLASDPAVVVLTESTSNVHHPRFFSHIDQLISAFSDSQKQDFQPQILLTLGGLVVSKKIKSLLRTYQPKEHWHIDPLEALDTYFSLTEHMACDPNLVLPQLYTGFKSVSSEYRQSIQELSNLREISHQKYLKTIPFCDFKVFEILFKKLPENIQLQIGNSSTIRYMQLFDNNSNNEVFCNRGTSGIDGSLSTAIGASKAASKPVLCVLGDLSFFYDSNALWQNHTPNNFRIIIINNRGGGIFRILPGPKNTVDFERYFETSHQLTAKHLAKMHGYKYYSASSSGSFKRQLSRLFKASSRPKILEVFTPRKLNDEVLLNYFKHLEL